MNRTIRCLALLAVAGALALPPTARATDVDGPDDCVRAPIDFGDAPEGIQAYAGGVVGSFPTCIAPGPIGTLNVACGPGGPVPGAAGFVRHVHSAAQGNGYWLGCLPTGTLPLGIDTDQDGKVNDTGLAASACLTSQAVDCVEAAFGLNFGQDECYGTDDAGIGAALAFTPCANSSVAFRTYSCAATAKQVYLNILVDWNHDGDWNDDLPCVGTCVPEWAVRNVLIVIAPGCNVVNSPGFVAGPTPGDSWLRISISDQPALPDFAWNGTVGLPGQSFTNGETEDYPVTVGTTHDPCPPYEDWGDAPEEVQAYAGILGHFPTCGFASGPGTYDVVCLPARSTPPGPTGHVRHVAAATDNRKFWLGCPSPLSGAPGVDGETDGKVNDNGGATSVCNPNVLIDCVEAAFGLNFGQDECYGDEDAGIAAPLLQFNACEPETVRFTAYNCDQQTIQVYLNVLVDMNRDGDWNDNFQCVAGTGACAYEWAVKNVLVPLAPGCNTLASPAFLVGPNVGEGWLRITLTPAPVSDDFPWDGSAGAAGDGYFAGGETEDYPVRIGPPEQPCPEYEDWGDAPEQEVRAYPGIPGRFPTCANATPPGTYDVECTPARSTPPGPTGYVRHVSAANDNLKFWLGCGAPAVGSPGVDSEIDGKVNDTGGPFSFCNTTVPVDCTQFFGITWGQDECFGDADAGIAGPRLIFKTCRMATVDFSAYNCRDQVDVFLNILVDMNEDGDWNDNFRCVAGQNECAYEWAVKNVPIALGPGCQLLTSPEFLVGPKAGKAWLRITLTAAPVSDDFPWDGSAGPTGDGFFRAGETEDYLAVIRPNDVGVDDEARGGSLMLAAPTPNPASTNVLVRFTLAEPADVSLAVYDIAGRRVAELVRGRRNAGEHRMTWDFRDAGGRSMPAGHYTLRLRAGDRVLTQRVMRVP